MAARLLLILLGVLLMAVGSQAQIRNAPKVHPRKEDIPFIKCQVCEHLAKNIWKQGRDLLKSSKPSKKVACLRHGLAWARDPTSRSTPPPRRAAHPPTSLPPSDHGV